MRNTAKATSYYIPALDNAVGLGANPYNGETSSSAPSCLNFTAVAKILAVSIHVSTGKPLSMAALLIGKAKI